MRLWRRQRTRGFKYQWNWSYIKKVVTDYKWRLMWTLMRCDSLMDLWFTWFSSNSLSLHRFMCWQTQFGYRCLKHLARSECQATESELIPTLTEPIAPVAALLIATSSKSEHTWRCIVTVHPERSSNLDPVTDGIRLITKQNSSSFLMRWQQ